MTLQDQKNTLQQARAKLEALLRHFTGTPSSLADSTVRGDAHKALVDIDSVLASLAQQEASQTSFIAKVVSGNLANRLEWASEDAHETTPVGTKLFDEAALAAATARGRDAGLEEACKALGAEAVSWDVSSQKQARTSGQALAKADLEKRDLCLAHLSLVRALKLTPGA